MAKPKTTTQLNTWESELASSAAIAAKAESKSVERPFFNTSGQLKLQGAILPHGAALVVLDNIHANLYYEGSYDPNNPVSPDCFAFGRDEADPKTGEVRLVGIDTWNGKPEMGPHKDVPAELRGHTDCATCPFNQFGSALQGKGKACQNTRRLSVIPGGTMQGDTFVPYTKPEQIESATNAFVKLPTMSVPTFSKLVLDTAAALGRPLWSMFTRMQVVPNPTGKLPATVVHFENLHPVPNALMDAVYKRMQAAKTDIAFPFQPNGPKPEKPAGKAKRKYV